MVPHTLQLRNFMCYGEDVPPLQFDGLRVACLSGANGAGKSTLLDAITWALWGEARAKSDDDLIMLGRDEMEVVFEFILDQHAYRVVRRRKRGKRATTTLEFQIRQPDGSWQQLTADTATETQRLINRTLRMQYDTFINSAFLLQGRADEFASRKPAERKQVLADILGLDEYEELERRARDTMRQRGNDLDMVRSYITRLESDVAERPTLEQRLAEAQQQAALLDDQIIGYEDQIRELSEQTSYLRNQRVQLRARQAERAQREQECRELDEAIAETHELVAQYDAIIAQQDQIEQGVTRLEQCRIELIDVEQRAEERQRLKLEYREWENKVEIVRRSLESDQKYLHEQLSQIDEQIERHAAAQRQQTQLSDQFQAFATAHDELDQLRAEETALGEQQGRFREIQADIRRLKQLIALQHEQLVAAQRQQQQLVDDLAMRAGALPELGAELADLDAERDRLDAAARDLAAVREALAVALQRDGELKAEEKRIQTEGRDLKEKLKVLEQGEGVCPICNSELGAHGVATIRQHYDDLIEDLRGQIGAVRGELKQNAAAIQHYGLQIEEREALLAERPQLEARGAELRLRYQQATDAQAALEDAQRTLNETTDRLRQRHYAIDEQCQLTELETRLEELGDPGALEQQLNDVRQRTEYATQRFKQATQIQQQMAKIDAELAMLVTAVTSRPPLQQRLQQVTERLINADYAPDERGEMKRIEAEGQLLGYSRETHLALREEIESLKHWERDMLRLEDALRNGARERVTLRRNQAQLQRIRDDLARLEDEIAELEQEVAEQHKLEQQLHALEQRRDALRSRLSTAQSEVGRADADLRRCDESERQLVQQREQAAALADERAIYEELVQAFGKKGVQAMLIETAIPEIEHEANELLGRMTDGQMHVAFETQRDTKTGNNTVETLDIRISDSLGVRDYTLYSGGEAFRVNFALRIALSKLLARRAGASLQTLIIDEGFGTQDAIGRDRIVEAINAIESDFERILVITHIQELKDMFPAQIEITKTGQGSQWVIT